MSLKLWINFRFFRVFCGQFLWTIVVITFCILWFFPPLPCFRSVLSHPVHVSLCPTSSISARAGHTIPGALWAVPARACGEPTVPTATGVPDPGAAHVPATLRQPPRVPPRAALPAGGYGAGQPSAHRHPTSGCAPLRTWVQRQIPANRGLLPSGSTSQSDQTFVPQGMGSTLHFRSCFERETITCLRNLVFLYKGGGLCENLNFRKWIKNWKVI